MVSGGVVSTGGGIGGSGTTNYHSKWTASGVLGNSLIWDNGTNVGIGNTNTSYTFDVTGTGRVSSGFTANSFTMPSTGGAGSTTWNFYHDQFAAGDFSIWAGSTTRLLINAAGNVGIGTTSPNAAGYAGRVLTIGNGTTYENALELNGYNTTDDTLSDVAFLNGASTDADKRVCLVRANRSGANNSGALLFYTKNSGTFGERMRISASGYTKMTNGGAFLGGTYHEFVNSTGNNYITTFNNTSSNPYGLYIVYPNSSPNSGSTNEFIWCVDSTNSKFIVWSNGTASNRTGTYGTISSDLRLKENITEATSKLEDILKLRVVNFNLIDDTDKKKQIGFIAQEFKEVFPSLVYEKDTREYDEDGNVTKGLEDSLGLNVGMEFAILVKAIQELKAEVDTLKQLVK